MIIYDLSCDSAHQFEAWFRSKSDYLEQKEKGYLSCPFCHSTSIQKIPSASYISTGKSNSDLVPAKPNAKKDKIQKIANEISSYIVANSEDVGGQFAEEAKKMHYGEVKERNIRGHASIDEVKSLKEEGIDVMPLPGLAMDKKKLN